MEEQPQQAELRLAGRGFGPAEAEQVASLLEQAAPGREPALLDLSCNNIGSEGVAALATALRRSGLQRLRELSLRDCVACGTWEAPSSFDRPLDSSALEQLLDAVREQASGCPLHLDLSFNKLGPEGAHALARALSHFGSDCANISLCLGYNGLGSRGCARILHSLRHADLGNACQPVESLAELDLRNNDIRETGAPELVHSLSGAAVRCLKLKSNHLGRDGIQHIGAAVVVPCCDGGLPLIRDLEVAGNSLGAEGVAALAKLLAKTSNCIERLDVHRNNCSEKGAEALAELLRSSPTLHSLRASNNNIREGSHALASAIAGAAQEKRTVLKELDVQRNPLADAEELASACEEAGIKHWISSDGPI